MADPVPVRLDPWTNIVNVGWGSAPLVVVEIDTLTSILSFASEVIEGFPDDNKFVAADPASALGVPIPAEAYAEAAIFSPEIKHNGDLEEVLPSFNPGWTSFLFLRRNTLEEFTEDPLAIELSDEFYRTHFTTQVFSGQSIDPLIAFYYKLFLGFSSAPVSPSSPVMSRRVKDSIIVNMKNCTRCDVEKSGIQLSKGLLSCTVKVTAYPPSTIFTPGKEGPTADPHSTGTLTALAPPATPEPGAEPPPVPVAGLPATPLWTFQETINDNYGGPLFSFDKKGRIV